MSTPLIDQSSGDPAIIAIQSDEVRFAPHPFVPMQLRILFSQTRVLS